MYNSELVKTRFVAILLANRIIYLPINPVETRRQSPTEGDPPSALAQISRLYTPKILTNNLN